MRYDALGEDQDGQLGSDAKVFMDHLYHRGQTIGRATSGCHNTMPLWLIDVIIHADNDIGCIAILDGGRDHHFFLGLPIGSELETITNWVNKKINGKKK